MLFERSIQALEMAHRACVRIMSELAQTRCTASSRAALAAHAYCIDAERAISEPITYTSTTTATIILFALK